MKLEKEPSSAATVDPKDKLAALREKRRLREAGTASNLSEKSLSSSVSISSASSPISTSAAATAATAAAAAAIAVTASSATATAIAPALTIAGTGTGAGASADADDGGVATIETPVKSGSLKPVFIESIEDRAVTPAKTESKIDTGASPPSVSSPTKEQVDKVNYDGVKRGGDYDRPKVSTVVPDDSDERIRDLNLKVSELSLSLQSIQQDKVLKQKEIITLNDLTKSLLQQLNKSQEEKDKTQEKLLDANKTILSKTNASSDMKKREGELEAQVNELMDTLEILTLDKEQLVMENELLQSQIDESRLQGISISMKNTNSHSLAHQPSFHSIPLICVVLIKTEPMQDLNHTMPSIRTYNQ